MRRYIFILLAAMLVISTGCGKFKDIEVKSAKVEKLSPYGLRGLDILLAVEVDNPAVQIKLSDMEAVVEYCGKILGTVTVDPFTMNGRSMETYHLQAKMILGENVSIYDILMLLDRNFMDKCMVDVTAKGKLKGGLSKTIKKNDIPLKKLVKNVKRKK